MPCPFRYKAQQYSPDLRELDSEMGQEYKLGAAPLLLCCRNFLILYLIFVEVGDAVNHHPGKGTTEVDDLVHREGEDACREDIVLHIRVPGRPQALEEIEMDIVLGNFVELPPVGIGRRGKERR